MNTYWVYILASQPRGTLHIGVTNHILGRVGPHREGIGSKFTGRYRVHQLVWFEEFADIEEAIQREKSLKRYLRPWKMNLIERTNLHWIDLYPGLLAKHGVPSGGARRALGPRDKPEDDTYLSPERSRPHLTPPCSTAS